MTNHEFTELCQTLYGEYWKSKAAVALGINRATVVAYSKGKQRNGHLATIKIETANKLRGIYESRN
jgi:hypothetical protein